MLHSDTVAFGPSAQAMLHSLASTVRIHDSVASLRSAGSSHASGLLSTKSKLHQSSAEVCEAEVCEVELHEDEVGGRGTTQPGEGGARAQQKQREQQRRRRADDIPLNPALTALLPPKAIP
jgi:hypothetical protein